MRYEIANNARTPTRHGVAFWVNPNARFKKDGSISTQPTVLLVRSQANQQWHGVWSEVPPGTDPYAAPLKTFRCLAGALPQFIFPLGILQPGDYPDIYHTTYVGMAMGGEIDSVTPRLPGVELGFLPLEQLPLKDVHSAFLERRWNPYYEPVTVGY
ncbi:MAG TPA: hypothetical protein VFB59_02590 [Candidatus Saccharimonadales bacterium]|nr:hypothetical protein [Candidatus Saccharimonadales bacterium]